MNTTNLLQLILKKLEKGADNLNGIKLTSNECVFIKTYINSLRENNNNLIEEINQYQEKELCN